MKILRIRDSWIWLLALFTLAGFVETIFYSQMLAFTPLYLPKLGVDEADIVAMVGAITAISNAVGIPFLPFWGALADRYSRQPIIVRSFVILLISGSIGFAAQSVWVFVAARAITGFALGNSGLMLTTLSERAPQARMGLAFSIMNAAAPIGAFVGPLIGGPIVDRWGFPTLLVIDSVMMVFVILGLIFGYRDDFEGRDRGPILRMAFDSVGIIWQSRRLRALFPALFLLFGGWMMAFTYVPLVIEELYQGEELATAVGLVLGAGGITTLILSPILGILADRFGYWRVLFSGAVAAVLLWPLPALTSDLFIFGIAWAVVNGVISSVFAISFTILSLSATREVRGRVMSFAYLPVNVGFMIGPAIGSLITSKSIFGVFPAAAVFTTLGIITLWVAYRQKD
ncbi:MAG: MFS transporter [Chloroflexi bacterium]|nr:MFS transporter [Chloroflexota bacterium]